MTHYEVLQRDLRIHPRRWLVTGAAGFIGSHLVEELLRLEQTVVALDNFATGHRANLEAVRSLVTDRQWGRFQFIEGDICRFETCQRACAGADFVLHQAALGSVPRSLADPRRTHAANVEGFVNMLIAARDAAVRRFVYASSSSVYGDHPAQPRVESAVGRPLTPYAATKVVDEVYAGAFHLSYGLPAIGLRYFNVFGPRQDPQGAYAAVIPRWFVALLTGGETLIHGDGGTTRDFCFVQNVVQANLLAAANSNAAAVDRVYNIGCGEQVSLIELHACMRRLVAAHRPEAAARAPVFGPERTGDVRHSQADIQLARHWLGYVPTHSWKFGLAEACAWYVRQGAAASVAPPAKELP